MIYKLSYRVAFEPTVKEEILAENEIELAHAILNMERDVGKVCYDVSIEKIQRPKEFRRMDPKMCLKAIQNWAKILEKDLKH